MSRDSPDGEASGGEATDVPRRVLVGTNAAQSPGGTLIPSERTSRRSVLGGLAAVAASGLAVGTASATDPALEEVPMPDVRGPITGGIRTGQPQARAVIDPRDFGYVEEEFLVSWTARALLEDSDPAPYATRILVYRPVDSSRFNGTLVVNWPNVTIQSDVPAALINTFHYLFREGYAVAMASMQEVGVQRSPLAFRNWDPVRYADADHPGDEYAFDMLSQTVNALRGSPRPDPDPMDGLDVEHVIAMGVSQSASNLITYINEVQEHHDLIDGFMPQASGSVPETVDDIRDDLVPILWLNSEDEADIDPREDGGLFKLWEVAGASHVNAWLVRWWLSMQLRDHGTVGGLGTDAELEPVDQLAAALSETGDVPVVGTVLEAVDGFDEDAAGEYGEQGGATCPLNLFPMRYAYRAGLHHLNEWVTASGWNTKPPSAPRLERAGGEVVTDEFGNARGGLRLPPVEVPVAEYDARSCSLFGQTDQLNDDVLTALYPTHDEYLAEMEAATEAAVDAGWLLPTDADDLMERARAASIPGDSGGLGLLPLDDFGIGL